MTFKYEHRIGVQAPAEVIWDLLADLPGWASWNPLYPGAEGAIRIGAPLILIDADGDRMETTVQDWVPYEQLHLRRSGMRGLVRSIRYFEIEKMSETGCLFSNGELYAGLASFRIKKQRATIKAGFEAMGEALRQKAEAIWRERQVSAK
ncbi:SRPBCC domain-containing protein [Caulobacter sp. NIBR2454]|uniref:SRPBCC domain-containing protein n=1 Tax=Caulobacter sp. NIBR2454 TaxID=3015996 RepID=UPI0022B629C4|nr:SRPBCC domain-containing protein [Caulobacter sp. NIBR2454]